MWSAYPFGLGIPLVRTSERERYERMTRAVEKKKTEVESVLHFRLPKHVRQTQLVTVMQLTKP